MLLDEKVFDSSRKRGEPAVFPVGRLIPGWNEALLVMKRGSDKSSSYHQSLAMENRGTKE